jgi:CheY-like chemotaxis protein
MREPRRVNVPRGARGRTIPRPASVRGRTIRNAISRHIPQNVLVLDNISRRNILKGIAAGSLVLVAHLPAIAFAAEYKTGAADMPNGVVSDPHIFVSIAPDGTVSILAARAEMGTGAARTSLPMIVADELDADWSRVRVVHWKAAEAGAMCRALRAAGHTVDYDEKLDSGGLRCFRQSPPDVIVIDLSRLPSHGREVATALRAMKDTRHIPIIAVGARADGARVKARPGHFIGVAPCVGL